MDWMEKSEGWLFDSRVVSGRDRFGPLFFAGGQAELKTLGLHPVLLAPSFVKPLRR